MIKETMIDTITVGPWTGPPESIRAHQGAPQGRPGMGGRSSAPGMGDPDRCWDGWGLACVPGRGIAASPAPVRDKDGAIMKRSTLAWWLAALALLLATLAW